MEPRDYLALIWSGLTERFAAPAFVGEAVTRMLAEEPPASGRAPVLSHNDVNPSNPVYDGERVVLFDWETAGPNDPYFDLATISVFLRMDDASCRQLLAAHDGEPVSALPVRFAFDRRGDVRRGLLASRPQQRPRGSHRRRDHRVHPRAWRVLPADEVRRIEHRHQHRSVGVRAGAREGWGYALKESLGRVRPWVTYTIRRRRTRCNLRSSPRLHPRSFQCRATPIRTPSTTAPVSA